MRKSNVILDDIEDDIGDSEANILDQIEPNLWLGGLAAATDATVIQQNHIHYILTIDVQPLPITVYDRPNLTLKFIQAFDMPTEDLLSHFDDTYNFIDNGIKSGGVLVHCYFGVSRSATIIIAYLMKKHNWSLDFAYDFTKSKRQHIRPNSGFLAQLSLFENMNYIINKNNVQYKMFRLYITAHLVRKLKKVPPSLADVIKIDPSLKVVKPEPNVVKCKKCRRILAQGSNIIPHLPNEMYSWRDKKWSENLEKMNLCTVTYFVEPLTWMEKVSESLEGKLICPTQNCRLKLGSFSWTIGCQCPCGTRVSPGFYLIHSKVDWIDDNLKVKIMNT